MRFSTMRTRAIFQKELREYRRNRLIVVTMVILPVVFIAIPIVLVFTASHSESSTEFANSIGAELLLMLVIPAVIPSTLASYSVVGEREQGTLEPVLTTPIRSEEFRDRQGTRSACPNARDLVRGIPHLSRLRTFCSSVGDIRGLH